jgi:hypothetical protein
LSRAGAIRPGKAMTMLDGTLAPSCCASAGDAARSRAACGQGPEAEAAAPGEAARLNRQCFCIQLDRSELINALRRETNDPDFCERHVAARPHLFSNLPVFLPRAALRGMSRIVAAITAAASLPGYREAVSAWAPPIARHDFGPAGAFMGYDFHLADDGPKLIEVNTNAGGAFLNAVLAKAQRACCAAAAAACLPPATGPFDDAVWSMFSREWARQGRAGAPKRVAIVDDKPEEQFLYPEFVLAQRFFQEHGVEAVIADAAALTYTPGRLRADGRVIDLVYNRLVDFSFEAPEHAALRAAYLDRAIVVTPNPWVHGLLADKRNLTVLSDPTLPRAWGLASDDAAVLARGIPRTEPLTAQNADDLWARRKTVFFKPMAGYGGKAVYRGDKITAKVWREITRGGYVAQDFASPGERMVDVGGAREARKVDVRLYVYDGQVLLVAARLYQGQTTNFRTPGGGFAPVFAI